MLRDLYIKNFAIIRELEINFTKGFNVLTGETGAGKSILIDAVGLILGDRANSEFIRTGAKKAFVQGIFEIYDMKNKEEIYKFLDDTGIEKEDDETLMLSREISQDGKNKCRINGNPVTLSMFRSLGKMLIDINGQHSHQSLFYEKKQLNMLDDYGGKKLLNIKSEVNNLYKKIAAKDKELQELLGYERDGLREKDLFEFQLQEIDEAEISEDEEEELLKEKKKLEGAQDLAAGCEKVNNLLYSEANCAYDEISESVDILQNLLKFDNNLEEAVNELTNVMYTVEEISRTVIDYRDNIEYDPQRLQEIYDRLDIINNLKRKYGDSINEILNYREKVAASLQKINSSTEKITALEAELQELHKLYSAKAEELSSLRQTTAEKLQKEIEKNLHDLAMPNVSFKINISKNNEKTSTGYDNVEFLFSSNPGEELKPLNKIASGGEMSRVMLAVKVILAEVEDIPVMIFDEIDTGIGGEAIKAVASKLKNFGNSFQVICVTHSPNIAAAAESHFSITKKLENDRNVTNIKKLEEDEIILELTRMLGGTDAAKQHAKSLIN